MANHSGMQYQPYGDQLVPVQNLGKADRILSLISGLGLFVFGATRRTALRPILMAVGSYLGYRAATGFCHISKTLGINTLDRIMPAHVSIPHDQGIRVDRCVTINRSASDLYSYWRNLENLPRVMRHLEKVTVLEGNRSHWVAKAPAGMKVEWDAEIINDVPNQRIGWRSLDGASVPNAGSVVFKPTSPTTTEVTVSLKYNPPGGPIGHVVAKLFGEEPDLQLQDDLAAFRKSIEADHTMTMTPTTTFTDNGLS